MSIHVIFPKPTTTTITESTTTLTEKQLQNLKFAAATRRLPLFCFWIFMGVAVLIAASLAHNRSNWQAFWNQEAILDRRWALNKVPLGIFFDSLTTKINKIFVKGGWIVAGVIIISVQAFYISLLMARRDRVPALLFMRNLEIWKMITIEVGVLIFSTVYFLLCTWIFNKIANETGSCTSSNSFSFPVSKNDCQAVFRGFDISGHCFLIVHSCLLALEYAAKLWFVWRSKENRVVFDSVSEKDSDVESVVNENVSESAADYPSSTLEITPKSNDKFNRNYKKYQIILVALITLVFLLCLSEFLVFLQTILFYHTVLEKILGTLIGAGFWILLLILSLKYPHLF